MQCNIKIGEVVFISPESVRPASSPDDLDADNVPIERLFMSQGSQIQANDDFYHQMKLSTTNGQQNTFRVDMVRMNKNILVFG